MAHGARLTCHPLSRLTLCMNLSLSTSYSLCTSAARKTTKFVSWQANAPTAGQQPLRSLEGGCPAPSLLTAVCSCETRSACIQDAQGPGHSLDDVGVLQVQQQGDLAQRRRLHTLRSQGPGQRQQRLQRRSGGQAKCLVQSLAPCRTILPPAGEQGDVNSRL